MDKKLIEKIEAIEDTVVCADLNHRFTYLNKMAKEHYKGREAEVEIGKSLLSCHNERSQKMIVAFLDKLVEEDLDEVYMYYHKKREKDSYMVAIRDENGKIEGYYEVFRKNEEK